MLTALLNLVARMERITKIIGKMEYLKGKGAQINPSNPYLKREFVKEHAEGIDESEGYPEREIFYETPKNIINQYDSPDLGGVGFNINPYQGCEHGCTYCFARNTHQYWGYSAGKDFESKIIVKRNAADLLEKTFLRKAWKPKVIMLSGNTDCYQPLEKRLKITRSLLEVFLKYRNPLAMITKNSLITRDLDLLEELASFNLVKVFFSINSLNEDLRRVMEPRTASSEKRFDAMKKLSDAGVPVGVMVAPVIPGLNDHEIPEIIKRASENGATGCGYEVVRLNGNIGKIFWDWLIKNFPDKASKVWGQIEALHGGKVNDSEWGRRLVGEGKLAEMISGMYKKSKSKYFKDKIFPSLDLHHFRNGGNLKLDF